jgi:HNH endonuclease
MAAFLLSWNPAKYPWDDLRKNIERVRRKGFVSGRWSCGNRTDLPKGSEFFLIRLGPALKGIVGRGVTASDPFEDKHWDPEKRRQKIKALYVKVRFTDLNETPVIPWEELQQLPLSRFKWSRDASGAALPEVLVEELDRRWMARKTQHEVAAPAGAGLDILSSHPFADQLTQELAILGREDLSPTEKESLIRARRGHGRYRQDLEKVEIACRLTGLIDRRHLRASHIKPWSVSNDDEKLDPNNGLLLSPHIDHLFDRGYISFTDKGELLVSKFLNPVVLSDWGLTASIKPKPFSVKQRVYLDYHRKHVFENHGRAKEPDEREASDAPHPSGDIVLREIVRGSG